MADVPADAVQLQATGEEKHPAWLLGHLLLADLYLLLLLGSQLLLDDFPVLLERYGPASALAHPRSQLGDQSQHAFTVPGQEHPPWQPIDHRPMGVRGPRAQLEAEVGGQVVGVL